MPITIFDMRDIPPMARERIQAAVEAGGKFTVEPHEAWISADRFQRGVRVLITGPQGFERSVSFAMDEQPEEITRRVRQTLDE